MLGAGQNETMNRQLSTTPGRAVASPTNTPEEVINALAALKEAHGGACDLRDLASSSDPELAFFFSQTAYIFARCLVGNAPTRRDFLSLAIAGQRAFRGERR